MQYPYFIYPDIVALRSGNLSEEDEKKHRRRIAANVGDLASLRIILGIDPEEFASFYPDLAPETPTTLDTIDVFLTKFAGQTENNNTEIFSEPDQDSEPIYLYVEPETSQEEPELPLEEKHLEESAKDTRKQKEDEERQEKLAINLIRMKNYQEALEIIMRLNLNNTEKSVYFADQIRFLKKLILNEAIRNKNTTASEP